MNEQLQAAIATWPIFLAIALIVAGCWWADDKNTIRRQQSEIDDLREELEYRHKRDKELARQREERRALAVSQQFERAIRNNGGQIYPIVPKQRTGGE